MKELLPDELWDEVSVLIPAHPPQPKGGNAWADDRLCLRAILFVLRSGVPWDLVPTEAFGVSGVTAWRRLRDWTRAGVWSAMHRRMLGHLQTLGVIDHSIGVIDSASVRAFFGGRIPGPIPSTGPSVAASGT